MDNISVGGVCIKCARKKLDGIIHNEMKIISELKIDESQDLSKKISTSTK